MVLARVRVRVLVASDPFAAERDRNVSIDETISTYRIHLLSDRRRVSVVSVTIFFFF
jgi:hypothetical protein